MRGGPRSALALLLVILLTLATMCAPAAPDARPKPSPSGWINLPVQVIR